MGLVTSLVFTPHFAILFFGVGQLGRACEPGDRRSGEWAPARRICEAASLLEYTSDVETFTRRVSIDVTENP